VTGDENGAPGGCGQICLVGPLWLAALVGLAACSEARIVEKTPAAVTVRYDGVVQTFDGAAAAARKACAAYGKTAHLRRTEVLAAVERYAHFDCVTS
jgi:hypothetical protein